MTPTPFIICFLFLVVTLSIFGLLASIKLGDPPPPPT